MWRLLNDEHRPGTSIRNSSMPESMLEDKSLPGDSFADWFRRWKDRVRETEEARNKPTDDDIKCAVVTRQAQENLKDHLLLRANTISKQLSVLNDVVSPWWTSKIEYGKSFTNSW